jgi:hypothetical protein
MCLSANDSESKKGKISVSGLSTGKNFLLRWTTGKATLSK